MIISLSPPLFPGWSVLFWPSIFISKLISSVIGGLGLGGACPQARASRPAKPFVARLRLRPNKNKGQGKGLYKLLYKKSLYNPLAKAHGPRLGKGFNFCKTQNTDRKNAVIRLLRHFAMYVQWLTSARALRIHLLVIRINTN